MTKIIYLGDDALKSTSRHRADALRRIGCEVMHLNPYSDFAGSLSGLMGKVHYRTGYKAIQTQVGKWISDNISIFQKNDICWVDNGELFGAAAIRRIQGTVKDVILFNHDDPTGTRDGARFASLRSAIAEYSLCIVAREVNEREFAQRGARDVMRVFMAYDEIQHAGIPDPSSIPSEYRSEVCFIGHMIKGESRDQFIIDLIESGLPVALWGSGWERSRHWNELRKVWRGGPLSGVEYVYAMQGAKICIGLLSKGNRDQHTTRSMEIPFCGGLLCAQRTAEHLLLYEEGVEAVFWDDAAECAAVCKELLDSPEKMAAIRSAGKLRVVRNAKGNQDICNAAVQRILNKSNQ